MSAPSHIAMWSGPRNLSTTMMRSFAAREDAAAIDEPFYAAFLKLSGELHPMQEEIFAAHPSDPARVIADLTGPPPRGKGVYYQKHMVHHMVPDIPRDWMAQIPVHIMLIRDPARVIASYQRKMVTLSLEAIGFEWQAQLFDDLTKTLGRPPPVVDADQILADPEAVLKRLCAAIDLPWDARMLTWPAGERAEDGAWAPHWYDAVWKSTGFGNVSGPMPVHDGHAAEVEAAARPYYERLLTAHV